jgi:hypothetical protein
MLKVELFNMVLLLIIVCELGLIYVRLGEK